MAARTGRLPRGQACSHARTGYPLHGQACYHGSSRRAESLLHGLPLGVTVQRILCPFTNIGLTYKSPSARSGIWFAPSAGSIAAPRADFCKRIVHSMPVAVAMVTIHLHDVTSSYPQQVALSFHSHTIQYLMRDTKEHGVLFQVRLSIHIC